MKPSSTLTRAGLLRSGALITLLMGSLAGGWFVALRSSSEHLAENRRTAAAASSAADADLWHDDIRGDVNNAFRIAAMPASPEATAQATALRPRPRADRLAPRRPRRRAVLGLDASDAAVLDDAIALAADYGTSALATIDTILADPAAGTAAYPAFEAKFEQLAATLDQRLGDLMDERAASARAAAEANNARDRRMLAILGIGSLVVFAFVGRRLLRVVTALEVVRAESDRVTAMVHAAPIGLVFADADQVVRFANPAFTELVGALRAQLGINPDQIVGTDLERFFAGAIRASDITVDRLPFTTTFAVGAHWVEVIVDAIVDDRGARIGTTTTWSDVTSRVLADNNERNTTERMTAILADVSTTATQLANAAEEFTSVSRSMASTAEGAAAQADTVSGASSSLSDNTSSVALGVGEMRGEHLRDQPQRGRGQHGRQRGARRRAAHEHDRRPARRDQRRDRQRRQGDHVDRRADEPAGAERDDRGGPRRRGRQGLRRRRQRGQGAGQGDRQGHRGHHQPGRRHPGARPRRR